jgi:hypothetical protein
VSVSYLFFDTSCTEDSVHAKAERSKIPLDMSSKGILRFISQTKDLAWMMGTDNLLNNHPNLLHVPEISTATSSGSNILYKNGSDR